MRKWNLHVESPTVDAFSCQKMWRSIGLTEDCGQRWRVYFPEAVCMIRNHFYTTHMGKFSQDWNFGFFVWLFKHIAGSMWPNLICKATLSPVLNRVYLQDYNNRAPSSRQLTAMWVSQGVNFKFWYFSLNCLNSSNLEGTVHLVPKATTFSVVLQHLVLAGRAKYRNLIWLSWSDFWFRSYGIFV